MPRLCLFTHTLLPDLTFRLTQDFDLCDDGFFNSVVDVTIDDLRMTLVNSHPCCVICRIGCITCLRGMNTYRRGTHLAELSQFREMSKRDPMPIEGSRKDGFFAGIY